jgi:hypothetical protein
MTSLTDLKNFVDFLKKHHHPKDITVYLNEDNWNKYSGWVKKLGSSGIEWLKNTETGWHYDIMSFGGFTFTIIPY